MKKDTYYTKEEVKSLLHISERTYFRWLKQGRLKRIRVGGKSLFAVKDVENLLKQNVK